MKQDSIASKISGLVNTTSFNPVEVGVELNTDHRYLQDCMFKMCLHFMGQMALNYENGNYDGRNQKSAELAHKIIEHLKEDGEYQQSYWSERYKEVETY